MPGLSLCVEASNREVESMTKHIYRGRTLSMIAKEHGLTYLSLYRLVVMQKFSDIEAINILVKRKDIAALKRAAKNGVKDHE